MGEEWEERREEEGQREGSEDEKCGRSEESWK